ncbi:MAG: hypothetical protein GX891_03105, partial [Clostridiales bacterium]|nr:hypothetical protein [Clostridiales bacterium]
MIDRRLDYELYRGIREGRRLPALCFVKNNADLRYLEEKYNVVSRFPFIRAVGVELDYKGAIELSSSPYVEYLTCQPKVTTLDDESKESIIDNTYLYDSVVEALGIETKLTGRGVTLCIMDTGVNTHSDLSIPRQRIKEFYDVENHLDYPYDDNGHGTFVA